MSFFLTLALLAVSFVVSLFLQPKPRIENAKAGNLGDFDFPVTQEGTPNMMFWGRIRMRAPNVLWYGSLQAAPITKKVKTGIFSSRRVTVGHRYFIGIHLGLGLHNPVSTGTRFLRIWADEKILWSGDAMPGASGEAIVVNQPSLFGGRENGGGFTGTIRVYSGQFDQGTNSYLAGVVPDSTILPAYRGLIHAVFEGTEVGEAPQVTPFSFEIESIPSALGFGAVGSEGDANPAEVIYDILQTDWGRLDIDSNLIDTPSFTAAAQTLQSENHGISLKIEASNDARDVLQEILSEIDGLIYEEPTTRRIALRLVRNDYNVQTLPQFDETNVLEVVNFSVSTWAETANQVRVVYNSRSADYTEKTAFAQDMSNVGFQGGVKGADFNYPGITTADLANRVVARELNLISIPLTKMRLITDRTGAQLRPGDVIRLAWPDYGIEQIVLRVQKFDLGELENGRIAIDVVQDRFAVTDTIYGSPPDTNWAQPTTGAVPVVEQRVVEMPRWVALQAAATGDITDPDTSYLQHFAVQPPAPAGGVPMVSYDAQISTDNVDFGDDAVGLDFSNRALVSVAYPITTDEYDTTTGLVIKNVTDSTILQNIAQASDISAQGANLILVGDELMAFETFTDNLDGTFTLNNVWRGILDTSPRAQAIDQRIWFYSDTGLETLGENEFLTADTVDVIYLTDTVFEKLDPSQATLINDFNVRQRPLRAYPPDGLLVAGQAHPAEVTAGVVALSWFERNRSATTITRPDAATEVTEANTRYIVRWRVDAGAFTEVDLGTGTSGNVTLPLGSIDLELYAQRGLDTNLRSLWPVLRTFQTIP